MAAETQYTANTGIVSISTANSNLDGTGTLGTVLTAASNGTLVKTVTIKAAGTVTQGVVRLFITGGGVTRLVEEIEIPNRTPSADEPAFEYTLNCDYKLQSGYALKAATQNAETFNVIAQGLDWEYYATSVRPESTNYTANTGMALATAANSNLDGTTGTYYTVITAGASGSGWKGLKIESITIKAIVNTTPGMVRLFFYDGSSLTKLFTEIVIPSVTKSATARAFETKLTLGNFHLQAGFSIKASTQNAESFSIIAEGNDWKYPA